MRRVELVGREREFAALVTAAESAEAGTPGVVLCSGEPGIGKTRLAEELGAFAARRDLPMVWGRAAEVDGASPFWPWRQVVRAIAALDQAAPRIPEIAADLALIAPEAFPGVVPTRARHADAGQRFRLFAAVARFVRAASQHRGLVVVLDDVHRADEPSVLLLRHLVRDLEPSRLLLLITCRSTDPTYASVVTELVREPATSHIELHGLSGDGVARQLAAITGSPVSPEAAAGVHALTGGNPFFVAEVALVPDARPVPVGVREAIVARLGRLSPRARHQVRVASVVGREFSVAVVAAAIGQPIMSCLAPMDEAIAAGLVEAAPAAGELRFVHVLVRDAIESALPGDERTRQHRAVAEALAELHGDRLAPHLSDLAWHWSVAAVAGQRLVAAGWAERAAVDAGHRLAFEEGARLHRLALDTGAHELDDLHRCRLLLALAHDLQRSSELDQARAAADEAAALASSLGAVDLLAEAALVIPCVMVLSWERAQRVLCLDALAALDGSTTALRARVLSRFAETGMYVDDLPGASTASAEALDVAERCADPAALVAALHVRALVRCGPDAVEERATLADRLLHIGREQRDPSIELVGHRWVIDVAFARGDLAGVAAELEQLVWCVDTLGDPVARWWLQLYRATLAQARGDFPAANRHLAAAAATIAPVGHPSARPIHMSLRLGVDHHIGTDLDAEHVQACLRPGPSSTVPGHAFRIMDLLGPAAVLVDAGFIEEAAAKFRALGPVPTWQIPPYHQLALLGFGVNVGIRVGADDAVAALRTLLSEHRGQHAISGKDVTNYGGPIELHLGRAAAHLGDLDAAVADLDAAAGICAAIGAAGFAVEAGCELASVLARRGRPADKPRARLLVARCLPEAEVLGMVPFRERLAGLATQLGARAGSSPLTRREDQVAACVARGLTNREIAAELFVSERTAESHVQHILTKLGFANRSQIAGWAARRP
ncbi:helix-turn-helix transcriptional regulator [Pseudonocardia sp. GCM10023141]|uniref:helix-turn-helix transcriptional regulator n=1 Tax=Pseudonocardia sp. GCM10023141 TaxID=3252653 RepID=UPI00360FD63F